MEVLDSLKKLTSIIWTVSELALALVIFGVLVFLLLGESSGFLATSITKNCIDILNDIGAESIIGVTIVLFVYLYLRQRSNKLN